LLSLISWIKQSLCYLRTTIALLAAHILALAYV
jgi:hypothetical protein